MNDFRSSRSDAVVLETLPVAPGLLATQLRAGCVPLLNSPFTKKKSLFLMIGPPTRKPLVSTLKGVLGIFSVALAALVPARSLLFQKRKTEPANSLVPLRVTALMAAPAKPDWRISYGVMLICNSSNASSEMAVEPVRPPAWASVPNPKPLLKTAPSMVKLLKRLS